MGDEHCEIEKCFRFSLRMLHCSECDIIYHAKCSTDYIIEKHKYTIKMLLNLTCSPKSTENEFFEPIKNYIENNKSYDPYKNVCGICSFKI